MGFSYNVNVLNQKGSPAIYTDTFANRPAFGFAGRLFIANDTAAIYEDTGTAWVLIANVSSGAGTLQQVTTNGNTSNVGISVTAGGVSTNSATITSLTQGSVPFVGASGLITQDNANLFFDDTNNRLGINTNTPSNNLDVHGSGTTALIALNNTASNQSLIAFAKNSTAKWRIGNSSTDTFDVLNVGLTTNAITISSASNSVSFLASIKIQQSAGFAGIAGFNGIGCDAGGFFFQIGTNTSNPYFNFIGLTAARTYTYPDATGTLALTSDLSAYLLKTGGTLTGNLTISVATGLSALTLNNASLSGKNWSLINTTNGADSDLSFFCSGTSGGTHVTFSNNGFVGIGTTLPDQSLTIKPVGTLNGLISFQNLIGNTTSYIGVPNANGNVISTSTTSDLCFRNETGKMLFQTNGSERLRISTAGNLLINTTTDDTVNRLQVNGSTYIDTKLKISTTRTLGTVNIDVALNLPTNGIDIKTVQSAAGGSFIQFTNISDVSCGNITHTTALTVAYNTASDYRLKQDLKDFNGIDLINSIKVYDFEWIEDKKRMYGVIAHEIQDIIPYAVSGEKDAEKMQGFDYSFLTPILTKAIQEQQKIIDSLIKRIELLENK